MLSDADRCNETADKECLAVVYSVFILKPYQEGSRFKDLDRRSGVAMDLGPEGINRMPCMVATLTDGVLL